MPYELSTYEWSIIRPMLPNKSRGVPRVDDRRILNGILRVCDQVRPGAINRLFSLLLAGLQPRATLLADRGYDADWIREFVSQKRRGRTFRQNEIAKNRSASALTFTEREIWSSGSSTGSSSAAGSPPGVTSSPRITLPSSSLSQSDYG
jgi:transposase